MEGIITDIKRFAVHDGEGIRTTVFFKGCPLECVWCHNPEGIRARPEIGYYEHKCHACGLCAKLCEANTYEGGVHNFDRSACDICGKCRAVCPAEAFTLYGRQISAEELLPILIEDKDFYESSGGGITLSGGECLMQADFAKEILELCKNAGLNTAVDTCGCVPRGAFDKVLPYTDVFLYDIKAIDPTVHKKCTGRSNELILKNLKYIDSVGCKSEIRIPYVPGYNSEEIEKIRDFLLPLKNVSAVKVLPYHDLAGSKYRALGKKSTLPTTVPSEEEIKAAQSIFDKIYK